MWYAPNSSHGYHEEMKTMWEQLAPDAEFVLLAGEGREVAEHFSKNYPTWEIETVNSDPGLAPDILADMCQPGWIDPGRYDLIIDQANLEHVYDPFGQVREMTRGLALDGIYVTYTVTQGVDYHGYPRDYFRFMKEWFEDLPKWLDLEVIDVRVRNKVDLFAAYRKR